MSKVFEITNSKFLEQLKNNSNDVLLSLCFLFDVFLLTHIFGNLCYNYIEKEYISF